MIQQRSTLLFEQGIKSEITRKSYLYQLGKFAEWAKVKNSDDLLKAPQKDIQILLEDYIMYLKKRVSPNTIPVYYAPIELFYVMNDVSLNFKKIRKLFPSKVKKGNQRGYSRKEIQTILNNARGKRNKALVILPASSGCRIGAIPGIKYRHLKKIEESYAIKIYEGDKEEDYIFTTPEATNIIDEYLDERRADGEHIHEDSPLFRTEYRLGIGKVKACTVDGLTHIMGRLVKVLERKKEGKSRRFDVAKNHGYRKFFATIIKDSEGMSPTMTEKLINHIGIVQMDGAYYTPSMEKMFEAYKKAIPELIINEDERISIKLEIEKQKNAEKDETIRQYELAAKDRDEAKKQLKNVESNTIENFKNSHENVSAAAIEIAKQMILDELKNSEDDSPQNP